MVSTSPCFLFLIFWNYIFETLTRKVWNNSKSKVNKPSAADSFPFCIIYFELRMVWKIINSIWQHWGQNVIMNSKEYLQLKNLKNYILKIQL